MIYPCGTCCAFFAVAWSSLESCAEAPGATASRTSWAYVVVTFRTEDNVVVVTAWRMKP